MDNNQQYRPPRRGFLSANAIWIVPLALILIMGMGFMGSYNGITAKDEAVNKAIRVIPGKFINDWFLQLQPRVYFKADEGAQTTPKVEF